MQSGVLRVLRATAASWWRHRELRRTGQTALAQRLERQTVLRDLGYLKQAASLPNAHVICGEGGTFLHLGWTTVSTLAPIERFPLAAFANLPCVARDGSVDPDPCGPGRSVSLTTYIDMVEALGDRIANDPAPASQPDHHSLSPTLERRPAMARSRTPKFDASEFITVILIYPSHDIFVPVKTAIIALTI